SSPALFIIARRVPRSTAFPYTTLFRSGRGRASGDGDPGPLRQPAPRPARPARRGGRDRLRRARRRRGTRAAGARGGLGAAPAPLDRKSTRLNSSHVKNSYAVFCLKKKN